MGVGVIVGVRLGMKVMVGVLVIVGVLVMVGVWVMVGVCVGLGVAVLVEVGIAVSVGVWEAVGEGMRVIVAVGVVVGLRAHANPLPNPSANRSRPNGTRKSNHRRMVLILSEECHPHKRTLVPLWVRDALLSLQSRSTYAGVLVALTYPYLLKAAKLHLTTKWKCGSGLQKQPDTVSLLWKPIQSLIDRRFKTT